VFQIHRVGRSRYTEDVAGLFASGRLQQGQEATDPVDQEREHGASGTRTRYIRNDFARLWLIRNAGSVHLEHGARCIRKASSVDLEREKRSTV
jgi:hypothetical protein